MAQSQLLNRKTEEINAHRKNMRELQKAINDGEVQEGFDDLEAMDAELIRMDDQLTPLEEKYNRMAEIEQRDLSPIAARSMTEQTDQRAVAAAVGNMEQLHKYNRMAAELTAGVQVADLKPTVAEQFLGNEQLVTALRMDEPRSAEIMFTGLLDEFMPARNSRYNRDITTGSGLQGVSATGAERFQQGIQSVGYTPSPYEVTGMLSVIPRRVVSKASFVYSVQREKITAQRVAEGAKPTRSTWRSNQFTVTPQRIRATQAISEDAIEDEPMLEGIISIDGMNGVNEEWNERLIQGNGTAPDQTGFRSPTTNTDRMFNLGKSTAGDRFPATLGETTLWEMINRGEQAIVMNGRGMPTAVVVAPDIFYPTRVQFNANSGWVFSNPANPLAMRAWGIPMVPSHGFPTSGADQPGLIMGDFSRFSFLATIGDVTMQMGYSDDGFETFTKVARFSVRSDLVVTRPQAFYVGTYAA